MSDSDSVLTDVDDSEPGVPQVIYDEESSVTDYPNAETPRSVSPEEASATLFKLQEFNAQFAAELKAQQLQLVADSLEKLRTNCATDVILISEEREFPVHRFVLAASCPYFKELMCCGTKHTNLERIDCDIDSESLHVILEFIYKGEASNVITEEQLKNLLVVSHRIKLNTLTKYCSQALVMLISLENFREIWDIAQICELSELLTGLLVFIVSNLDDVTSSNDFCCASLEQLKQLLWFAKSKARSLDKLLLALIRWVQHVLVAREAMVDELFSCVEPKLVSKDCILNLLDNDELMNSSREIADKLKDIAIVILHTSSSSIEQAECDKTYWEFEGMTIVYFNEHCLEELIDPQTSNLVKRQVPNNCVQQFDLHTMTWLPPKKLCFSGFKGTAMCQYNHYICIVGGSLGPVYVMYDIEKNSADYITSSPSFNGLMDAGMCACMNKLYVIGGCNTTGPTPLVHYAHPGKKDWYAMKALQQPRASPTILATSSVIYVVGGINDISDRTIEYFDLIGTDPYWVTVILPNIARTVQMHFFLSMDTLRALYFEKGDCISLTYFHKQSKWQAEWPAIQGEEMKQISRVLPFPNGSSSFICASLQNDHFSIPDYMWDPETGQWFKIKAPTGKCLIPDSSSLQIVYSMKLNQSNFAHGPEDGQLYEWKWNENKWQIFTGEQSTLPD